MVVTTTGYLWKRMELRCVAASPAHTVLSKTCRAEAAEASVSHVTVKVSCRCRLEPGSNCHAWKVPPCVCQPGAGMSQSTQLGGLQAQ